MLKIYRCHWLLSCLVIAFAGYGAHARAAGLQLSLGEPQPLPDTLYTFNTNLLTGTAFQGVRYGGTEFERAVRDLRPRGLRFPGGTIANNYRWREDSFSEQPNDKTGWAGKQLELFRKMERRYDLPGFAAVCKRHGVRPIWVLNVYEESPESLAALLAYWEAIGLDVEAVEFGNEPYWDPRSLNRVDKYIAYCRPLAERLRRERPEVKIGACFAPLGRAFNYEDKWNAVLARETWFDAVVFHGYYGGQGFSLEPGEKLPAAALLRPEALIDQPLDALTALVPDRPIWFTEWNIGQNGLGQWKNSGAELLFLAASFTRFVERRDAIRWACFHQIYDGKFGTFYYDKSSGEIQTTASYQWFRLLGAMFAEADALRPFSTGDDELRGFATQAGGDLRLLLVNRGAEPRTVHLPPEVPSDAMCWTIECPPEERFAVSRPLAEPHEVDRRRVTLPAYSISVIASGGIRRDEKRDRAGDAELFPVRPLLRLWYPPYAKQQPRVDATGTYTLDLAALAGKPMAVVQLDLKPLRVQPNQRYTLSFDVQSDIPMTLPVTLPERRSEETTEPRSVHMPVGPNFRSRRMGFHFTPEVNEGEISFFFSKEAIAKAATVSLRRFTLRRAGGDDATAGN